MNKRVLILILLSVFKLFSSSPSPMLYEILDKYISGPKKELFQTYHFIYEKEKLYPLYSEEGIRRYNIFKNNLKFINEENAKNHDYKFGLGPFTDMTKEEFEEKMLTKPGILEKQWDESERKSVKFLRDTPSKYIQGSVKVDWEPYLNAPRNQGGCGCCWAFATLTATEANFNIHYNKKVLLSPQQLVDCDMGSGGCNGGIPENSIRDYIPQNGISQEADYPYRGKNRICQYENDGIQLGAGLESCQRKNCSTEQWIAQLQKGAVSVTLDAAGFGQHYKSGILNPAPEQCKQVNHAVVAFGVDNDGNGDYIKVRNSWGPGWGDKGNFSMRINPSTYTCYLTEKAHMPLVKDAPVPPPKPPKPDPNYTCPTFYDLVNYEGKKKISTCDLIENLGSNSNMISSVKIGSALEVSLYSDIKCAGERVKLIKDTPSLTDLDNRSVSLSISFDQPRTECIWVYSNVCHVGVRREICTDIPDLASLGISKKVSSFRFGNGIRGIRAFKLANYKGASYDFKEDSGNIKQVPSADFDNNIISIQFIR